MDIKKFLKKVKHYTPMSKRGWLVFFAVMGAASLLCLAMMSVASTDAHVPLVFVLAVLVVSLTTDGYFYGVLSSLTSVVTVNYAFTYPYAKMDFSIYGYPITFMTMLAVSIVISTLAGRLREQEKIRMEAAKEKVRANLLRAISHDLRTPLTSISGVISAVTEAGDDMDVEQRNELLKGAAQDADWLCRMVENLLSVTRMSGGDIARIKKEEELLEEVISEAVMTFKKKNPDINVTVAVPDELLFVPMDAMLVEQVLLNLMDNSVIHGIHTKNIRICAEDREKEAYISICDDGKGIDSEILDRLFDGSLQFGGDSAADKTRGLGIGLSVCKTIIDAHGGSIAAENLPQGGACFCFTLAYEGENT